MGTIIQVEKGETPPSRNRFFYEKVNSSWRCFHFFHTKSSQNHPKIISKSYCQPNLTASYIRFFRLSFSIFRWYFGRISGKKRLEPLKTDYNHKEQHLEPFLRTKNAFYFGFSQIWRFLTNFDLFWKNPRNAKRLEKRGWSNNFWGPKSARPSGKGGQKR